MDSNGPLERHHEDQTGIQLLQRFSTACHHNLNSSEHILAKFGHTIQHFLAELQYPSGPSVTGRRGFGE